MALVAYDYDSASDNDEEDEEESSACVIVPPKEPIKKAEPVSEGVNSIEDDDEEIAPTASSNLFSKLPETKSSFAQIAEDKIEDFIPKSAPVKPKAKVKITIPSLSQFNSTEDDDEPENKRLKSSVKGSSLLSLLPPVKGSVMTAKSFVPKSVAQKSKTAQKPSTSTSLVPHAVRLKAEAKKQAAIKKLKKKPEAMGSDVETDDEKMDLPETYDDAMWEKVCGRQKPKQIIKEPEPEPVIELNIAPEPVQPYEGLNNEAFKELVGKNKRPIGNIKLIDINEEEITADKDVWMTRALTDPEMEAKAEEDDEVDPTKKRKHHITYLAQRAKAQEQDLKNQWSSSKNNRLMTRAKYGF